MLEETLRILEFDRVRQILAGFTATAPGRERAEHLGPLTSRDAVEQSLAEFAEAAALLEEQGRPPLGGCRDLRGALAELKAEGTYLEPEALLEVAESMEATVACRRYYAGAPQAPLLGSLAETLVSHRRELAQIRECLDERGEVRDSASFELGDIRQEIRRLRDRIKRVLEALLQSEQLAGVFQERIITERGGRYVVPVRADHRGQLKGFVHDESASGQTLFVEPVQVLEDNNRLRALQREELREIERILHRLGSMVRRIAPELLANQELLARLDLRTAAGHFGRACRGCAVTLEESRLVDLKEARHPLLLFHPDGSLRREPVVPIDLRLGEDCDALVISGPNTGGKTVALKTLGLLLLMVRSGLPVPCHAGSRVHLFEGIFADIGDEQSIEESLSTFSGHLRRLMRIFERADAESLVLLDEVGTGTDPAEGGALALAVLDTLRRRGAKTVVTTHLNLVKGYAQLEARLENAAVEFDSRTLAPTYRLHYGIPGASSAFAIARRFGLPEEVLERAAQFLDEGEREGLELIERLNRQRRELDRELEEAAALSDQARKERDKRRRLLREIEEGRKAILDKAARKGEQVVRDAERRLKDLLRQASSEGLGAKAAARTSDGLRQAKSQVAALRSQPVRQGRIPNLVDPGEILRITSLQAEATVVRQRGDEVELDFRGKRMRLPLRQLEQFSPPRFADERRGRPSVGGRVDRDGFQPRLLLVGRRVDEALPLLERFLDDALLHGVGQVEVVHGSGEGTLRKAVREALAQSRAASAFYAAPAEQGGDNVTVVELRD